MSAGPLERLKLVVCCLVRGERAVVRSQSLICAVEILGVPMSLAEYGRMAAPPPERGTICLADHSPQTL